MASAHGDDRVLKADSCKNWRDFIWLSSGIYKGRGKLTKFGGMKCVNFSLR
ncbi:hypothetical protein DEV92_10568 [Phyllobacterium myrsinacearum]|nr:hypothetical protein DEV92_10568 [Phyllobacterium myrsinacearum]